MPYMITLAGILPDWWANSWRIAPILEVYNTGAPQRALLPRHRSQNAAHLFRSRGVRDTSTPREKRDADEGDQTSAPMPVYVPSAEGRMLLGLSNHTAISSPYSASPSSSASHSPSRAARLSTYFVKDHF